MTASNYWMHPVEVTEIEAYEVFNQRVARPRIVGPMRSREAQVVAEAMGFIKFLTDDVEIKLDRGMQVLVAPLTSDAMEWVLERAGASVECNILEGAK